MMMAETTGAMSGIDLLLYFEVGLNGILHSINGIDFAGIFVSKVPLGILPLMRSRC